MSSAQKEITTLCEGAQDKFPYLEQGKDYGFCQGTKMSWKILDRHKHPNITISESYDTQNPSRRRYTATILGFQNWKLYQATYGQGSYTRHPLQLSIDKAKAIKERITAQDEAVFNEPNIYEIPSKESN